MFVAMKEALKVLEANDGDDLTGDFMIQLYLGQSIANAEGARGRTPNYSRQKPTPWRGGASKSRNFADLITHRATSASKPSQRSVCLVQPPKTSSADQATTAAMPKSTFRWRARYSLRATSIPLRAAAELSRCRAAAERLVRTVWAQQRIRLLAEALLRCGTLSGEEIHRI